MAMTKCKECGNEVSTKAASCPKCGAITKKKIGFLGYIGAAFLILIIVGIISSLMDETSSPVSTFSHRSPPATAEPKLLLLNWSWHEEYGYAIVEGEVKNISSENLQNVEAVANFYTAEKKFITSADALIEYNPILPGQTSPFKAMTSHNPAMKSASITFKTLMGGTIPWNKKE